MTDKLSQDEAFNRWVLPEIEVLLRVARSLTRHGPDAEDLVQDTLLRAYKGIERFDGRHPRAWLLTILRNTNINRNRRQRPHLLNNPDGATDALSLAESPDRADETVEATFDTEVKAALAALPANFKEVVTLVDIDQLSYAEAAEMLDIPTGTVMSGLHRARKRIRDHLNQAGFPRGAANETF